MFDFLPDYVERAVARFECEDCTVDTSRVSDGRKPYETGLKHKDYRNGEWIITEAYDTKEQAEQGHKRWAQLATADNLPETLVDCCNAEIQKFEATVGCETTFKRKRVE